MEKEETKKEEVKNDSEVKSVPIVVPITPQEAPQAVGQVSVGEEKEVVWNAKTAMGRKVLEGSIVNIDEILFSGKKILESEIVDKLIPGLQNDLILIGGRAGKGGGIQRTPIRVTAKMHSSGRRFKTSALFVVGNGDGIVGIGRTSSVEPRASMEKSLRKAKLNIIKIKRGCGDWECGCGLAHSIPYKTKGHAGSVKVELMPAPKGVGLVADNETKKILRMAGIKDIWVKTFGNTSNRINLIFAVFAALKKLYIYEK